MRACVRHAVSANAATGENGVLLPPPPRALRPLQKRSALPPNPALPRGTLQPGTEGYLAVIMPWTNTAAPEITNAADRPPPDKELVEGGAFQAARPAQ